METHLLLSAVSKKRGLFYFSSPSENHLLVLVDKLCLQPFQSSCLFSQAPVKGPSPCRRGRSWPWWRRTKGTAGPASAGATATKATFPRPTSPSPWTNDRLVQERAFKCVDHSIRTARGPSRNVTNQKEAAAQMGGATGPSRNEI